MQVSHYLDPRQCDVFLCGPSPGTRDGSQYSPWRCEMTRIFDVFDTEKSIRLGIPEFGHGMTHERGKSLFPDFDAAEWETKQIKGAVVQVFWLDFAIGDKNNPDSKPGFDTRLELGIALGQYMCNPWLKSVLVGIPEGNGNLPRRMGLIRHHLDKLGIRSHNSMESLVSMAVYHVMEHRDSLKTF